LPTTYLENGAERCVYLIGQWGEPFFYLGSLIRALQQLEFTRLVDSNSFITNNSTISRCFHRISKWLRQTRHSRKLLDL